MGALAYNAKKPDDRNPFGKTRVRISGTFDDASGNPNLEMVPETGEPSDKTPGGGSTSRTAGVVPEEKDKRSENLYQGEGDREALKAWADQPFRVAGWKQGRDR